MTHLLSVPHPYTVSLSSLPSCYVHTNILHTFVYFQSDQSAAPHDPNLGRQLRQV